MKTNSKNIRLQAMIRPKTMQLLIDYCNMEELDISRAVDELLSGRLSYLKTAEINAKTKFKKEQPNYKDESKNKQWIDNYWSDEEK